PHAELNHQRLLFTDESMTAVERDDRQQSSRNRQIVRRMFQRRVQVRHDRGEQKREDAHREETARACALVHQPLNSTSKVVITAPGRPPNVAGANRQLLTASAARSSNPIPSPRSTRTLVI